jgi:hypothetical protein
MPGYSEACDTALSLRMQEHIDVSTGCEGCDTLLQTRNANEYQTIDNKTI